MSSPIPVRLQTNVWNPMGERRALLVHGLGSDGATWWRLAGRLAAEGFMVLAPDLRSHGNSPTAEDHSLAALAEDVVMLGEAYDLVVGHSIGGAVAATLLERPCFSSAAVLLDPVLRLDDADRERLRRVVRAEVAVSDPDQLRAAEPRWDERDVQRKLLANTRVTPDVVDAVLDHNDPWDLVVSPGRWRARVHVVAADPALGALSDGSSLDRFTDGDRVTASTATGCGHSIHRERPDLVLEAVHDVLSAPSI